MAGAGIRVFSSGEILTAAQVNQYLMDQVITRFADAATRDASFGGVGQPTLTEGRFCYLDSTNVVQFYDGSTWNDASQFTVGDGTITTVKLADGSVTADKIADGTVIAADIADNTITNAKINSSAAIALSKLASGTSAQIVLANSSGVPTYTTVTGDIAISNTGVTTIQPNSVTLGTDTTGDYVSSLVAGTGITLSNNSGESATPTIAIGQAVGTSSSVQFAAVTAPLVGNASTASTLQTARTISISGDVSGSVSFNGSANVDISATIQPNSVALGTDTTGNYMVDVSAGTGISVTHTQAEGSTATIALADTTIVSNAGSYSLTTADKNKIIEITGSSSASVTVPANSSQAFPTGSQLTVIRNGSGTVRVIGAGGVTIRRTPGEYLRDQYSSATLIKRATDEWYLIGDLSA